MTGNKLLHQQHKEVLIRFNLNDIANFVPVDSPGMNEGIKVI